MRSRGARGNDIWGWEAADSSDRSAPKAPLTPLATSPPAVSADNFSRNARRVSESVWLNLQVFGLYSGRRAVGISKTRMEGSSFQRRKILLYQHCVRCRGNACEQSVLAWVPGQLDDANA